MQEIIGLIGSICFAISSWPQAYYSTKNRTAKGVKWSFLFLWLFGSIFCTIYAIGYQRYILLPNYICGGLGTLIVLIVKIKENNMEKKND